jgi:2-dehydro-3-deoxyphosphogluconate aldolase/(4S)-4-hydroxy-2-oxoglutarate aldolase
MNVDITRILEKTPVVPLVQADDPQTAVRISRALARGGLTVAEVVLRSDAAMKCLAAVASEVPEMIAGAGTVLSVAQAEQAIGAGARFVVSPGLDADTVRFCQSKAIPIYPGVITPSEATEAWNLGLRNVKFFPATLAGGIPMLKALGSVFRDMRFMPTGGISVSNLADYLALQSVLACGGSWLTPAAAIEAGNYDEITRLAAEAVAIAIQAKEKGDGGN